MGKNLKTETSNKYVNNKTYLKATEDKPKKVLDTKISYPSSKNDYNIYSANSKKKMDEFQLNNQH